MFSVRWQAEEVTESSNARPDPPPSVDTLARSIRDTGLPHPLLVEAARSAIAAGEPEAVRQHATNIQRTMLQRVINATGTLLHTNLGRAPNGVEQDAGFRNLELDLSTGERGSRQSHAPKLFAQLCGAESAMVVNNCASAVLLILGALAQGRGVAVSRGELVEIGGGFRVPEVMEQSGARLIEVGTTNRTRREDYVRRIEDPASDVALAMQIHQSNYRITGFTEMPSTAQLADLGVPLVSDIGSGLLDAACPWLDGPPPTWLDSEPAARQTLAAGADLVLFSGDKLLGGPQAGIIAGSRDLVEACGKHPLARALRPGDLVLQALQQLTLAYLERRGDDIPFWRLASRSQAELEARADAIVADTPGLAADGRVRSSAMDSVPGGGTLPTVTIASHGLRIDGDVSDALRGRDRPLVARVEHGATWLDLRTVEEADDAELGAAVSGAIA